MKLSAQRIPAYVPALLILMIPLAALGSTTGAEFQIAYQFFYDAATGYLGRGIAIVGGLIGLGYGAAKGSPLPAVLGVILAVFGALGPTIIDAVFGSAVV
ncbi:MAG: conjugal transfer protein TraB [Gammaproteobacteria bacterium]|nr:conjugal transfer protein TraB [Gammaproteobacteria bacterium]